MPYIILWYHCSREAFVISKRDFKNLSFMDVMWLPFSKEWAITTSEKRITSLGAEKL